MRPSAWDFQNRLTAILNSARQNGQPYIDVESDQLHRQVDANLNANQTMPVCWDVMIRMMRAGDAVLREPANGQTGNLVIRYNIRAARRA
ncbi:MAG TPA: hypothetical protein VNN77_12935 [candidate division Zixibacteria bacterium]|nr:hypothetical protein [candidate division Zixibacteria bacterium]